MSADFDEAYYLDVNPDIASAIAAGSFRSGWEHFIRFGRAEGRKAVPPPGHTARARVRDYRSRAADHLRGQGIEIGALHDRCPVGEGARVTYCDRITVEQARRIFPGLASLELTPVEHVMDLDTDRLKAFATESQDFVVLNNVIQLVANPIACIEEVFRVTRPGGHVVISILDKNRTHELARPLTDWEHLLDEYLRKVDAVTDAHYVDLFLLFFSGELKHGVTAIEPRMREFRKRMEHVHVWDTRTFREFLRRALRVCDVEASVQFEVGADETGCECFSILRKDRQLFG
jgi:SAM-dependent methyltransferase